MPGSIRRESSQITNPTIKARFTTFLPSPLPTHRPEEVLMAELDFPSKGLSNVELDSSGWTAYSVSGKASLVPTESFPLLESIPPRQWPRKITFLYVLPFSCLLDGYVGYADLDTPSFLKFHLYARQRG